MFVSFDRIIMLTDHGPRIIIYNRCFNLCLRFRIGCLSFIIPYVSVFDFAPSIHYDNAGEKGYRILAEFDAVI